MGSCSRNGSGVRTDRKCHYPGQQPGFRVASGGGITILIRSGFKTPSEAQWLRCKPLQNAHILTCMLRFFIGLRLALEPYLGFLNRFEYLYFKARFQFAANSCQPCSHNWSVSGKGSPPLWSEGQTFVSCQTICYVYFNRPRASYNCVLKLTAMSLIGCFQTGCYAPGYNRNV